MAIEPIKIPVDTSELSSLSAILKDIQSEIDKLEESKATPGTPDSKKLAEAKVEFEKINKLVQEQRKAVQESINLTGHLALSFEEVYGEVKPLTSVIGELEDRMYQLVLSGQKGSEEYAELFRTVTQYKRAIQDMDAEVDAGVMGARGLGEALSGVAGHGIAAFQGLASAQALFGTESEELQKVMVKLQAAAGMADAIASFGKLYETVAMVKGVMVSLSLATKAENTAKATSVTLTGAQTTATTAQTTASVAQTGATEAATGAQLGLNAAMLANPVFLAIAAISALTAAYFLFGDSTDNAAKSANNLTESIQNTSASFSDYKATLMEIYAVQNDINAALSDKDVILAQNRLTDILRNRPNDYKKIIAAQADLNNAKIKASEASKSADLDAFDLETDLDKKRREQIKTQIFELNKLRSVGSDEEKAARIKLMADLQKEDGELFNKELTRADRRKELETKLNNSILQINIDNNNKIADIRKAAAEYEKKLLEEKIKKEEDNWTRLQELTLSENEFKKLKLQQRYDEEIAAAEGNAELQKALTAKLQNDLNAIDNNAKEESLRKEQEVKDKKQALYDSYYSFINGLETDAEAKRLQQLDNETAIFKKALEDKLISQEEYNAKIKERTEAAQADIVKIHEDTDAKIIEEQSKKLNSMVDNITTYVNAGMDVINAFVDLANAIDEERISAANGNEEAIEAIRKKSFEREKRLKIIGVVINTAEAVAKSVAASPTTFGLPFSAFSLLTGAAQIAAISKTQYGGSATPPSTPPPPSATPSLNLFGNNNNQNTVNATTNQPINVNNQVMVKAVVSETEITDAQRRVNRYRSSSEL